MELTYDRVRQGLADTGLEDYETLFQDQAIDDSLIDMLDDEMLSSIGVPSIGHRLRILAAFGRIDMSHSPGWRLTRGKDKLAEVLASGKLDEFQDRFAAEAIDDGLLGALDEPHLIALGLTRLGDRARFERAREERVGSSDVESRHVTSLCWDIAESTMLENRVGTGGWRRFLREFRSYCNERLVAEGGYHLHYAGDGQVLIFGYPQASEHDALRAVRAALNIVHDMPDAPRPPGVNVSVRIGIAMGDVEIDRGAAKDDERPHAVGTTVNLSARLQQDCAPANAVAVSNAIWRQVNARVEMHSLGVRAFKGFAKPLEVWCATAERGTATSAASLSIGRDNHLIRLSALWKRALSGEGTVVLMSGEAGIGKSHLLRMALAEFAAPQTQTLEFNCSPFAQSTVLYPLMQHLLGDVQVGDANDVQASLERLAGSLGLPADAASEDLEALANLFGLSEQYLDRYGSQELTPQRSRLVVLDLLERRFLEQLGTSPSLVLFEDLHWADPTTLELMQRIFPKLRELPVLVLATTRTDPERAFPGQPFAQSVHDHVEELILDRLSDAEATQLARVTAGKPLTEYALDQIVFRAEGNPLFIEEMTRFVVDSPEAVNSGDPVGLPGRLRELLQARIDGLGQDAVRVARAGAILGRTLSREVLRRSELVTEPQLDAGLRALTESGLLLAAGDGERFTFKHALIRDAAYRSWPRDDLRDAHRRIAETLTRESGSTFTAVPESIAFHFSEAGEDKRAAGYWLDAGRRAAATSSHYEAREHLQSGLSAVRRLGAGRDEKLELDLLVTLGTSVIATAGYTSKEADSVLHEAVELSERAGTPHQRFTARRGLWAHFIVASKLDSARDMALGMLELADAEGNDDFRMEGHRALGQAHTFRGEFASGLAEIEQALALYDPARHAGHAVRYGNDSLAVAYSYKGWLSSLMGNVDTGLEFARKAVAQAREVDHPFTIAQVETDALHTLILRGDIADAAHAARATVQFSTDQGFPYWSRLSRVFYTWARFFAGRTRTDADAVNDSLQDYLASGAVAAAPWCRALAAEALAEAGHTRDALALVDAALDHIAHTRERIYEPEIARQQAMLIHANEGDAALPLVLDALERARERAREQQALSSELRCANSLATLLLKSGHQERARGVLGDVRARVTEGLDTTPVQQCERLLADANAV